MFVASSLKPVEAQWCIVNVCSCVLLMFVVAINLKPVEAQ